MSRIWAALAVCGATLLAQSPNPVQWTLDPESATAAPGSTATVKFTAKIESGWHIYALTTPPGGPQATSIKVSSPVPAVSGIRLFQPKPETLFDQNFNMNVEAFEHEVSILVAVDAAKDAPPGAVDVPLLVRYQACTATQCLPKRAPFTLKLTVDPAAPPATSSVPPTYTEFTGRKAAAESSAAPGQPAQTQPEQQGLLAFLGVAFGFGLAAIFTPCVFPMIPITLSFFLNQPGVTRGRSVQQALVFCLGIIVLFTAMGILVTAVVGPFGVVQLGSNPWVNGFIALVFVAFGLSLLGGFEITLPSALLTRMNQASERGGVLGTLLMGLTFSLTSFACVGPFVGTLLAGSVGGDKLQPVLGMATFAAGLSLPFFVLALFPSYLQRMPRSGGWLARVKIVLGFIILAAALKYLSSIDQVLQWNVLTRERFLAAWVVLFALPGLYLLGFLRMEGIRHDENAGVTRTLAGAAFLIFSISLIPGMFGSPLGELDSWVPLATGGPRTAGGGEASIAWRKNDFDGAMTEAKQSGKLVLVSFTGYACTNCHWMKANMFTKPEVADAMKSFVLVELYTDGTDPASEANQKLQESKFSTVAIPFYAIFDADGRVVATFAGLTRKTPDYLAFLRSGAAPAQAAL